MIVNSPFILEYIFPDLTWNLKTTAKEIFLTLDDGPHPHITTWVLDCLKEHSSSATFFCVGENVCKYPKVFDSIIENGNDVGNHTYNHLNGWKTRNDQYVKNILKAGKHIDTNYFRPPYGRITPSQIKSLRDNYKIIMWSILTCDFDSNVGMKQCLRNSIKYTKSGSIVVFHDSEKSQSNLKYALPKFLRHFIDQGYRIRSISKGI